MAGERVESLLREVGAWAAAREDVRAAFLLGSHARTEAPADEWSDVDVVLLADDPVRLVEDPSWLATFGEPELTFVEQTAVGGERERRVLYADGTEVDFAVFPASVAAALAADPGGAAAVARGYRILHDEIGLADLLAAATAADAPRRHPREVVHDFWYHALWTAKKLRRGEAVTALLSLGGLAALLLELARAHALARDPGADTWHRTRFVERWADPRVPAAIWAATAAAPEQVPDALFRLCDAFDELAAEMGALDTGAGAARVRLRELLA